MKKDTSNHKKKQVNFTMVSNIILNDPKLSWKAKAVFAYIYSKPDTWNFSVKRITNDTLDGLTSTTSAINELEDNGFIKREKDSTGRMIYYITYERNGLTTPESGFPNMGKTQHGKTSPISNTINISNTIEKERSILSASPKKLTPQEETTPILTKDKEQEGSSVLVSKSNKHAPAADAAGPAAEPSGNPEQFDSKAYAELLCNDKQPHIKVIGWYFLLKKMKFPTKRAADAELRRNLKTAIVIADYFVNDTIGYRTECEKYFPTVEYDWTLETVLKKLPEIGFLNKKNQ